MIREATMADVPTLVLLGHEFLTTTGYHTILSDNPAQMEAMATQLVMEDTGVVYVSDHAGTLTGMLGMVIFRHHLSAEPTAGEVFWYVAPDARGDGLRLVREAERWARAHGATKMQMVAPNGTDVGKLYARLGFDAIEIAYQKDLAA